MNKPLEICIGILFGVVAFTCILVVVVPAIVCLVQDNPMYHLSFVYAVAHAIALGDMIEGTITSDGIVVHPRKALALGAVFVMFPFLLVGWYFRRINYE